MGIILDVIIVALLITMIGTGFYFIINPFAESSGININIFQYKNAGDSVMQNGTYPYEQYNYTNENTTQVNACLWGNCS